MNNRVWTQMPAAVFFGPGRWTLQKVSVPRVGPRELLVRVHACSICGTDRRIYTSGHFRISAGVSRILGHEFAGVIEEVGEEVQNWQQGMRVSCAPNIGCGVCQACLKGWNQLCPHFETFGISYDGGFALYCLITEDALRGGNLLQIPDNVSFEQAALNEPLSCCENGIEAAEVKRGDVILIVGAGPIGLMHMELARVRGAGKIFVADVLSDRLRIAEFKGADALIQADRESLEKRVLEETDGWGVDVAILACSSHLLQEKSLQILAYHGRVNFFGGLPPGSPRPTLESNLIHYKELKVVGSTGSNMRQYRYTMELLERQRVNLDDLITHRIPLSRFDEALKAIDDPKGLKVVICPD